MFFFGRRYSHNKLCLYNTKTHEKIERGADNLLQKYLLPLLIVEDIPEGEYLLYTSSEDGQESSKGYPVIFTGNKKADILSNMVSLWNLSDNLKTEIQEDMNQEEDVLFYLYRNYLKETDEDLLLARAKLLAAYLDFWNKRIKGYHLTPSDFLVDDENKTVTMDEDSEFLMQIDLKYLTIHIFPKTETNQIPVQEKTEIPYLYLEMDREHMPMNLFLSFTFRESIWSKIKTERNTRQENYQRAIEKQISYPSNIDFSEDKLPYLSIIDKL